MASIPSRPPPSIPQRPVTVAEPQPQAPQARAEAPAQQPVARQERDSFSPASLLRPSGRVRMRNQGDNFVMEVGANLRTPNGRANVGRVGVSGSAGVGASLRVEVPRGAATEQIRNGQLPNPGAPETWPIGTRATGRLEGNFNAEASLSAGPGAIAGRMGISGSFGQTYSREYSVQRVNEQTVRVSVTDATRQQDSGNVRGLRGQQDQTHGVSHSVDFDISSAEGRAAYQRFFQTGQLPTEAAPGVSNLTRTDRLAQQRDVDFQGLPAAGSANETTIEQNAEGQRVANSYRAPDGSTHAIDMTVGPDGVGRAETRLNGFIQATTTTAPGQAPQMNYRLQFNDPNAAAAARIAFGLPEGSGPLTVNLNEAQARALIERTTGPGMASGQRPIDNTFRALSANGELAFASQLVMARDRAGSPLTFTAPETQAP